MDGARQYYAKQNKSEKDKYHISFIHMWNLRNKISKQKKKKKRETN